MLFPNVYIKHLQKYIQWAKKKMSHSSKCIGQSLRPQCYDIVTLIKNLQTKEKKSQTPGCFKRQSFKALWDCTWWSMLFILAFGGRTRWLSVSSGPAKVTQWDPFSNKTTKKTFLEQRENVNAVTNETYPKYLQVYTHGNRNQKRWPGIMKKEELFISNGSGGQGKG